MSYKFVGRLRNVRFVDRWEHEELEESSAIQIEEGSAWRTKSRLLHANATLTADGAGPKGTGNEPPAVIRSWIAVKTARVAPTDANILNSR